jgi:septal ring factor EnvC (AmiA/AmiB activator)
MADDWSSRAYQEGIAEGRRQLAAELEQSQARVAELEQQLAALKAAHRKELNELHREHARDIRDACAQARDDAAYDARSREGGY